MAVKFRWLTNLAKTLSLVKPSRSTLSKLWYLLHLSSKYDLDLTSLYRNLIEASTHKLRVCGPLTIEYRGESEDSLVFLLTDRSGNTEGQLRIPLIMLKEDMMLKFLDRHRILTYEKSQYPEFLDYLIKTKWKRIMFTKEVNRLIVAHGSVSVI